MNYRIVFRLNGIISFFLSFSLLGYALGLAFEKNGLSVLQGWNALLVAGPFLISTAFFLFGERGLDTLRARGAILLVAMVWVSMVSVGAVPYSLEGVGLADAIFESASGFSTTGSTVFSDFSNFSASLLMWRCFSQWIGGMGIIVFFVALLPALGKAGKMLFRSEVPGPVKDSLTPHMRDTTRLLWLIYLSGTVVLVFIYKLLGMNFYDAIAHSFATISTGGFSVHEESMAFFSPAIQWTAVVFMLLSSINFSLYAAFLLNRRMGIFNDTELRWYLIFLGIVCVGVAIPWMATSGLPWQRSLLEAVFTVVSITTTTGYTNVDFELFPLPLQMIVLLCFFTGGSASSPTGGIKFFRVVLFFKLLSNEIKHSFSPSLIASIRVNHRPISTEILQRTIVFVGIYFTTIGFVTMLLYADGLDFFTAFSAGASSVGNIGPGFSSVGPSSTFGDLSAFAKIVCSTAMVIGRLEFFTILTLFHASFWRS